MFMFGIDPQTGDRIEVDGVMAIVGAVFGEDNVMDIHGSVLLWKLSVMPPAPPVQQSGYRGYGYQEPPKEKPKAPEVVPM